MIIDLILDRKDNMVYDSLEFCEFCLDYVDENDDIVVGLRSGDEAGVKAALRQYIKNNEYNPLLVDYIEQVNWVGVTAPEIEKEAAEAFEKANNARWTAADKAKAPDGKASVLAYECGVLVGPDDSEFDYYANNNPNLPYGFYDESQGMFATKHLDFWLDGMHNYVKNGVDNTYAIISFQGLVDFDSKEHIDLLNDTYEFDVSDMSYTFFKNANEVVWSCCKKDGKLIIGFLEKELESLKEKGITYEIPAKVEVPKDKIFVAVLDYDFDISNGYPEDYTGDNLRESYAFDTPEEFVAKWNELDEGAWFWVFDKGEIVCSGALDPNDIEILEDHWGKKFDTLDLPESISISAATLALDSDDIYKDEEELADILSDYLSDTYGYCHKGFSLRVVYNEFDEPSKVVVTDIKWDVDEEIVEATSLDEKIEAAKSSAVDISHIPLKIIEQDR